MYKQKYVFFITVLILSILSGCSKTGDFDSLLSERKSSKSNSQTAECSNCLFTFDFSNLTKEDLKLMDQTLFEKNNQQPAPLVISEDSSASLEPAENAVIDENDLIETDETEMTFEEIPAPIEDYSAATTTEDNEYSDEPNYVAPPVTQVDIVNLEGDSTVEEANELLGILSYVPSNVLNTFSQSGFKLILTSYDIASVYYGDSSLGALSGLFSSSNQALYISNYGDYMYLSTIHELGHFVDYSSGWPSYTDEFVAIYNEEASSLVTEHPDKHYMSSSTEFFAQCFKEYCLNPGRLGSSAPKAYEYVDRIVASF